MALIKVVHGPMSGKIGANVYSRNKGGAYVRLGSKPTNPTTSRQQAARAVFGSLASAWSAVLTAAQRAAWVVYAAANPILNRLGEEIYLSGEAMYVRTNARLSDAGLTLLADPPIGQAPPSLTTFAVEAVTPNILNVTFTPALPAGAILQLWMTKPGPAGRDPNFAQATMVGYSPADQATPWAATAPLTFQVTEVMNFYCKVVSDEGLASASVKARDDAEAPI